MTRLFLAPLLILCACVPDGALTDQLPSESATTSPSPTASAKPSREATSQASSSALDLLECDGAASEVGGAGEAMALESPGGDTPDDALAAFLIETPFVIPRSGYEPLTASDDRHAYAYRADGEVKVAVVVSRRFAALTGARFTVDELRTCPQAEFGADTDLGGAFRVWTHDRTGAIITDVVGSSHCGWESVRLLNVEDPPGQLSRQYVRDPLGVLAGMPVLMDTYAERVDMPPDSTFTGYRSPEGFELWFTTWDRAAYVVTPEGIERWPRAEEPIGCA